MKQIIAVLVFASFALNVSAETITCETENGNVLTLKYDKEKAQLHSLTSKKSGPNERAVDISNLVHGFSSDPRVGTIFDINNFPQSSQIMSVKIGYREASFIVKKGGSSFGEIVPFKTCKSEKDELDKSEPAAGGDPY